VPDVHRKGLIAIPKDGTTLRTQLTDRNLNPVRTVANGTTGAQTIHIELAITSGVTFNPEDIYDALVAKYGAGKVSTDRDTTSMGQFQYRIAP
jgi:hypothetical protein